MLPTGAPLCDQRHRGYAARARARGHRHARAVLLEPRFNRELVGVQAGCSAEGYVVIDAIEIEGVPGRGTLSRIDGRRRERLVAGLVDRRDDVEVLRPIDDGGVGEGWRRKQGRPLSGVVVGTGSTWPGRRCSRRDQARSWPSTTGSPGPGRGLPPNRWAQLAAGHSARRTARRQPTAAR